MDLKTFIFETLTQIVSGVGDAQSHFREKGLAAQLNPTTAQRGKGQRYGDPSPVEFDVALTIASESEGSATGKASAKAGFLSVVSGSAGIEGTKASKESEEHSSRVRFTVRLAQPADVEEWTPVPNHGGSPLGGY